MKTPLSSGLAGEIGIIMQVCLAGLLGVLLVVSPAAASAQTAPEKELAQKRYKVGEQLYDIGQYEKALVEFEEAYRLYPLPAMLYNIARTKYWPTWTRRSATTRSS